MKAVVLTKEMQAMDRRAMDEFGVPGVILMENAGRHTAEAIMERVPRKQFPGAAVLCGKGNNGGDGFVIARVLDAAGYDVRVFLLGAKDDVKGDAAVNMNIVLSSHIPFREVDNVNALPADSSFYVDALLGTGLSGPARGLYKEVISWLNERSAPCFSVDIPSGLSGDSALVAGGAVKATATFSMACYKPAHLYAPAKNQCGAVSVVDIGFPGEMRRHMTPTLWRVEEEDIFLRKRADTLYKNRAGKVLVIGGSAGLTGAVTLSALGASACGAGLVVAAVPAGLNGIMENKLTEQMTLPLGAEDAHCLSGTPGDTLMEKVEWADAVIVGPGMGRAAETGSFFKALMERLFSLKKKTVIDADGLYHLARAQELLARMDEQIILTPHFGEFKRLFPELAPLLEGEPWQACRKATEKTAAVINLKGAPSTVGQQEQPLYVNSTGNAVLARGGSGDILSGVTAALLAGGQSALKAAWLGNALLGRAGDLAAGEWGRYAAMQTDIVTALKHAVKEAAQRGEADAEY